MLVLRIMRFYLILVLLKYHVDFYAKVIFVDRRLEMIGNLKKLITFTGL